MKAPGDILLVACYELGHQPLAVAWPAAFLERLGFRPAVMDVSVDPFDVEKVARAKLVAISVPMHTALRLGVAVAERVRSANSGCHITFFGLYAGLNAEYLFAHGAQSVISGEVEKPLTELAQALEVGDARQARSVHMPEREAAPHLERLDFPLPSRTQLPSLKSYAQLERDGRQELTGYVEASRGCRHLCLHCPIPPVYDGRFFAVPIDIVMADIRQQVDAGARHITFGDPDFLNGPTHALRLARAFHAEFPSITFDFTAKIEHLLRHRAHLAELRESGCIFVISAAESLSDTVLDHLAKGHTRADISAALGVTRAAGIDLRPTWVAFTPWTTIEDYQELLDFIEGEDLIDRVDPVQYSLRLLVPPGSLLLQSDAMRPCLGALDPETFTYRWTHPDNQMDRLQEVVAAAVGEAADRGEDAAITFPLVRSLADEAAGRLGRSRVVVQLDPHRPRPPRITEPWFC
ncbi:MAG TPA: CUAEP/CCAEP-tail radical SAM protein [Candidatus Methylomirabilis sp.]|nr:CUAEP/CCAEP-tail radical SAM protein [Candidatus Methylomirabilis sp.]